MPIQWGHQDISNFVNNYHLFRMFESGRNDYRRLLPLFMDSATFENMENGKLPGLILASQSAEFFTSIKYPDRIDIATRVIDIKKDRLSYNTVLFSRDLNEPISQCIATCVSYDHNLHKKVYLLNEFKLGIDKMEANPSRTQQLANNLELRKFNAK
ncbi:hypothetical protein CONCODRAFT_10416 [Conidiobolus coronatus NRRL 28638]|uniref:Thioesterase domain-containing protein n=1 Tax=Conidiobolus coronatus (strain ATCC 28846 / CBS 209.66 / NRRL 28638) TaxID=796925 RepID=A0A137NXJ6_CONC2|nr:hypothetical protein CONCODRAFT_10416 [Conidiobolus coronatus NRRL 28638]|eukprot:KXN67505.1 hypothetical protein CONCODRAFT_10416 [Conidiobolus coronatus NRRL 28638]